MSVEGVQIETARIIFKGSIEQRYTVIHDFLVSNIFTKATFVIAYLSAIWYRAAYQIAETDYLNARKNGLEIVIPIASWDDHPKLSTHNDELLEKSRSAIRKFVGHSVVNRICVKLASGHDSIGTIEQPGFLADIIKQPSRRWEILLLDPDKPGAYMRGQSYCSVNASDPPITSTNNYIVGIRKVLDHLTDIRNKFNIEVKLYSHNPVWKIYLTATLAIVQTFGRGNRSDRTPLYIYRKTATSMYHGYSFHWQEVWDESRAFSFNDKIATEIAQQILSHDSVKPSSKQDEVQ